MSELSDWVERAHALRLDPRAVIHGERVSTSRGPGLQSVNPSTGELLFSAPSAMAADIDRAVSSSRAALSSWSQFSTADRAAAMMQFADLLDAHADELGLLDTLEMGMPISGSTADVSVASALVRWCAEAAGKVPDALLSDGGAGLRMNVRVPRGVVGAITPWNFPTFNVVSKVAPALATGNVMVVKPSEIASLSSLRIAELLLEAGLPPGAVNVVPGLGHVAGEILAGHRDVDFMSFTGSTATGRRLMEVSASTNLKPLALELGGKSPQVVFADSSDLEAVADAVCDTAFWNSGQVCTAGSRLIVEDTVRSDLVALIVERAAAITIGDPLDPATTHGPLATGAQRDRVRAIVGEARAMGARVLVGGQHASSPANGFGYEATVIEACAENSVLDQEIFGPVLSVQSFSGVDEAIELANDTDYGLAAYVWSGDLRIAHHVAREIRSGSVLVNPTSEDSADGVGMAVEPARASGFGPEGGMAGMNTYTRLRSISMNL